MNLTCSAALSNLTSPTKRKATAFEDDSENIDPIIFLSPKKSKNADGSCKDIPHKPINYFLTKAPPSPNDFSNALKPTHTSSPHRPILAARCPAPRLNTSISKPSSLSAPAGRSPTKKRIGILNRRRTASPFTRVDPPKFNASSGLGFSIDAALSGTIPSYGARQRQSATPTAREEALPIPVLHTPQSKDSWFFDIHEDTEEELATNLMEHSTCTLDISSDEESALRTKDERGKENVPPLDDISQTQTRISDPVSEVESSVYSIKATARSSRPKRELDDGAIDVDRSALGELSAEEFYAEGCDGSSVFLVPSEEGAEDKEERVPMTFDFVAEVEGKGKEIDELMRKDDFEMPRKAALLEPLEKAENDFELWGKPSPVKMLFFIIQYANKLAESGSSKADEEPVMLF